MKLRTAALLVGFVTLFSPAAQAADATAFFKNYFVTGDYVVGGVGLRGLGVYSPTLKGSYATGIINIGGSGPNGSKPVPVINGAPADVVAAFLYWQTDEPIAAIKPSAMKGFFDGKEISGASIGNDQNLACDQAAARFGRVYRADVLRHLAIDHVHNVRTANGPHTVSLPDSGAASTGTFTNGASLVVIYRIVVPGNARIAPLTAVVMYDGSFTWNSGKLDQTIAGFYQAQQNAGRTIPTRLTAIVGNGDPSVASHLNIITSLGNGSFSKPFTGAAGPRWDNPTFNAFQKENAASYSLQVTNTTVGGGCLTFGAWITSTPVVDSDYDALLDVWETKGLHVNKQVFPATFGGCSDYPGEPCVNLPALGAIATKQDIFLEFDWLRGSDHVHIPKYAAVSAIGATLANHNIALHADMGSYYPGQPYIIPAAHAKGGQVIDEATLGCPNKWITDCAFHEPYSVLSYKRGFRAVKDGFKLLDIPPHFDPARKDIFHYVLFAHALAGPFDATGKPLFKDPKSVSGVADRPGGDVMTTFGLWRADDLPGCDPAVDCADQTGTALQQAGTLMHEVGHNLGLSHAGLLRLPNCMPNYPSVMNYLYQVRGLTGADAKPHIDWSMGKLKSFDEGVLPEAPGAFGAVNYRLRFYGPPLGSGEGIAKAHCDGTPITEFNPAVRLEATVIGTPDWNRNGNVDNPYAFDVNYTGRMQDGAGGGKLFVDSDDWGNLNLQQIGARLNPNGLSVDVGALDLGALDLGALDLGDSGALDLGALDLGALDLGALDLGALDLGALDLGDLSYDDAIASLDPVSADTPLTAVSKIDRISLSWGAPGIGQIRRYNIYRSDPAHPTPALLSFITGTPPVTAFDDIVNDFTHAGTSCPATATCYNTAYTYYITAVDINQTESSASNTASGKVTRLFVIADNQNAVYGDPIPSGAALTFKVYGEVQGTLTGVSCGYASVPKNVGIYPIICTGPATVSPTNGVTYNVTYDDGTPHVPGNLTIIQAPQTIAFAPLPDKIMFDPDFMVSATATSGLPVSFTASGNCTVTGNVVHLTDPGSCSITASQAGDSNYLPAPDVTRTFTIAPSTTGPPQ